jgi:hypothetical protein
VPDQGYGRFREAVIYENGDGKLAFLHVQVALIFISPADLVFVLLIQYF